MECELAYKLFLDYIYEVLSDRWGEQVYMAICHYMSPKKALYVTKSYKLYGYTRARAHTYVYTHTHIDTRAHEKLGKIKIMKAEHAYDLMYQYDMKWVETCDVGAQISLAVMFKFMGFMCTQSCCEVHISVAKYSTCIYS